jgi:hypothetical protein
MHANGVISTIGQVQRRACTVREVQIGGAFESVVRVLVVEGLDLRTYLVSRIEALAEEVCYVGMCPMVHALPRSGFVHDV